LNSEYIKLLSDPRWHKKRLRIFKRDGYKCTVCGKKQRIEAHHTFYYEDYREPWLYPNSSLITLCKNCHKEYHLHNEVPVIPPPFRKKKDKKTNGKVKKIKHKMPTKFKIGTTYKRVMRKINGEYKEVLRKY
jgi:5-methylcytosine-specific restriction endonuclease McrA